MLLHVNVKSKCKLDDMKWLQMCVGKKIKHTEAEMHLAGMNVNKNLLLYEVLEHWSVVLMWQLH